MPDYRENFDVALRMAKLSIDRLVSAYGTGLNYTAKYQNLVATACAAYQEMEAAVNQYSAARRAATDYIITHEQEVRGEPDEPWFDDRNWECRFIPEAVTAPQYDKWRARVIMEYRLKDDDQWMVDEDMTTPVPGYVDTSEEALILAQILIQRMLGKETE